MNRKRVINAEGGSEKGVRSKKSYEQQTAFVLWKKIEGSTFVRKFSLLSMLQVEKDVASMLSSAPHHTRFHRNSILRVSKIMWFSSLLITI